MAHLALNDLPLFPVISWKKLVKKRINFFSVREQNCCFAAQFSTMRDFLLRALHNAACINSVPASAITCFTFLPMLCSYMNKPSATSFDDLLLIMLTDDQ